MEGEMEEGKFGLYYQDRRVFQSMMIMKSKVYTPLIFQIFMGINARVLLLLLLLVLGGVFHIGSETSPVIVLVFAICITSFLFSIYLTKWVLAKDEGPPETTWISHAIQNSAKEFLRTQYENISKMALLLGLLVLTIYLFRRTTPQQESSGVGRVALSYITLASFLLGALCSGVSGYVGMWISVRANFRVSSAARRSGREALQIAVHAGGVSAIIVVGMAVLGLALLYSLFYVRFYLDSPSSMEVIDLPILLVGYSFGASFVAQLGGGIFTKAADIGADVVGKVEQGIPEDDPRNPAVIANLVGDTVGDCCSWC